VGKREAAVFRIKTYALVSLLALASVAGGYAMTSAAEHVVKGDLNQTFVDAGAGYRKLAPMNDVRKINAVGQNAPRLSEDAFTSQMTINRINKGDRLSAGSASAAMKVHTIVVRRPAPTPEVGCEPLAAPYADHVLGHIIGRCDV
jgi:hypothetical protein